MSISTVKPVACRIPPVAGGDESLSGVSKVKMMSRQAHPPLQEKTLSSTTSRREMMQLTAASLGLLSIMLPPSAEAAARNATMRQKIMEKFEELRRKAGLSKPKDEGEDKKPKDEEAGKSKVESRTKEATPQAKAEGGEQKAKDESQGKANAENNSKEGVVVIPGLPGIINGAAVEITLP